MFRYHLLGLLRDGNARHGYALKKEYRQRAGLEIGTGSFYRELQTLAGQGLVRPVQNPSGADPRRAPYEITKQGLGAFDRWFCDVSAPGSGTDIEISARAIFLPEVKPEVGAQVLARWQLDVWDQGKRLERELREALSRRPGRSDTYPILLRRRLRQVAADIQFLEEIRDALDLPDAKKEPEQDLASFLAAERPARAKGRA